jgi:hypothetical protein
MDIRLFLVGSAMLTALWLAGLFSLAYIYLI